MWQGPTFPNSSSNAPGTVAAEHIFEHCGDGCLYNLEADPGEHTNLAVQHSGRTRCMHEAATVANSTVYAPVRGKTDPLACYVAYHKYNKYWGPWLNQTLPTSVNDADATPPGQPGQPPGESFAIPSYAGQCVAADAVPVTTQPSTTARQGCYDFEGTFGADNDRTCSSYITGPDDAKCGTTVTAYNQFGWGGHFCTPGGVPQMCASKCCPVTCGNCP